MSEAFRFDEATHTYWLGSRQLAGVSSIAGMMDDFRGIPREVLERKTQIGLAVHHGAFLINCGKRISPDSIAPEVKGYLDAYLAFKGRHVSRVLASERQMYSEQMGLAGTVDLVYDQTGSKQEIVADIKTVAVLRDSTALQVSGYRALAYPDPVKRLHVGRQAVQLKPDGTYHIKHYTSPDDDRAFLGLLAAHNWKKKQ